MGLRMGFRLSWDCPFNMLEKRRLSMGRLNSSSASAVICGVSFAAVLVLNACGQYPELPRWALRESVASSAELLGQVDGYQFYLAEGHSYDRCLIAVRDDETGGYNCANGDIILPLDSDVFLYSEEDQSSAERVLDNLFKVEQPHSAETSAENPGAAFPGKLSGKKAA